MDYENLKLYVSIIQWTIWFIGLASMLLMYKVVQGATFTNWYMRKSKIRQFGWIFEVCLFGWVAIIPAIIAERRKNR